MRALLLLALAALLPAALSGSEVYKWVDADGVVHYSEHPPESGEATAMELTEPPPSTAPELPADPTIREASPAQASRPVRSDPAKDWNPAAVTPEQARCYEAWTALQDLQRRGDVYLDEAGRLHRADSLHGFWYESWRRWLSDSERREWEDRYQAEVERSCAERTRSIERNAEAWNRWQTAGQCAMARAKLDRLRGEDGKTPRGVVRDIEELIAEHCD